MIMRIVPDIKSTAGLLSKRLWPLYLSSFFLGCVLWYALEKLFMRKIGFSDTGIGVMVAAYSAFMLILETPTGIIADRWSRRGMLMIASLALAASGFICGISTEPTLYIVGALLWGAFYATHSGLFDTMVYDTLIEEAGSSERYEKYYGRIKIASGLGLVAGAIVGGIIGQVLGLRATYILSIPLAIMSVLVLFKFKEPKLHKIEQNGSLKNHLFFVLKQVFGRRELFRLVSAIVIIGVVNEILYEFSQLWLISTNVLPLLFGPADAAILSAVVWGGYIPGRSDNRQKIVFYSCMGLLLGGITLTFSRSFIPIVIAQTAIAIGTIVLSVVLTRELHDRLPSRIRASSSSAVSTVDRLVLIPLSLIFGALSEKFSTFAAAWVVVVLALLAAWLVFTRNKNLQPLPANNVLGGFAEEPNDPK